MYLSLYTLEIINYYFMNVNCFYDPLKDYDYFYPALNMCIGSHASPPLGLCRET